MSNILGALFKDIADAIRGKTGDTAAMKPTEFPTKISEISVGSSDETLIDIIYGLVCKNEEFTSGKKGLLVVPNVLAPESGNTVITIDSYSLANFKKANYAKFNYQAWFYDYSVAYNPELKIVDIEVNDTTIPVGLVLAAYSFYGCTSLEKIIIRYKGSGEELTTQSFLIGQGFGAGNGILEGTNDTFEIYISEFLHGKMVSQNPYYANRMKVLEDYPEVDAWMDNI